MYHSVARIRALETGLLDLTDFERMLGAKTFEEAFSVLDDLGYAEYVPAERERKNFEVVLEQGLSETRMLFGKFPMQEVFMLLFLPFDLLNVKWLVKAKRKNEGGEFVGEFLLSYAFFSKEEISKMVFSSTPPKQKDQKWLWDAAQKAILAEGNLNAEEILENAFFEKMKAGAKASKDAFVQKFVATFLDVQNIKRYFRKKNLSLDEGVFLPVAGGNISLSVFSCEDEKDFLSHLPLPFSQGVREGMEFFRLTGKSTRLEDLLDRDFLQLLLSFARSEVNGMAPLFSFFWRKERNARVIRSVLVAKKNNIHEEEIRKAFSAFVF